MRNEKNHKVAVIVNTGFTTKLPFNILSHGIKEKSFEKSDMSHVTMLRLP